MPRISACFLVVLALVGSIAAGLLLAAEGRAADAAGAAGPPSAASASSSAKKPSLQQALAALTVPPPWLATTPTTWNMSQPWSKGRLEIRRLLAGSEAEVRQGVKLTWLYTQKNDIGDGHELPMYLFMSGQYAWAVREYPPHLKRVAGKGATHAWLCYASCLAHFGEYAQALDALDQAAKDLPPSPWAINAQANIMNARGDIHAAMGQTDKAKECYQAAIQLYPTSNQPYGRHLLARQVSKVQTKLNLLTFESLSAARLRDGRYVGKTVGYAETPAMEVTVTVRDGRIADIQVKHQEKIDLNATSLIPRRIVDQQSLKVDAITGATVTSQAIVDGAYKALQQAGLR